MKVINLQRVVFKDTWKSEMEKMTWQPKFHCSNSKWYSVVCMAPTCLYACLITLGHDPYDMTRGVKDCLLPDPDQSFTELLKILRGNPADVRWSKTWCPRDFLLDLGQASVDASQWYQFLHPLGTASILLPGGIIMHHLTTNVCIHLHLTANVKLHYHYSYSVHILLARSM